MTETSALAAAQASGERVVVPGKTSETEQTFANPDGSLTLEQSAVPVRVRGGAGWVPTDLTLSRWSDGTVRPAATAVELVFSGGGSSTALARVGRGGTSVALGWPAPLPVPSLSGDTATYAEVLAGVDLRVRARVDGFSEVLVVKSAQAARQAALKQIRFTSKVTGGVLQPRTGGGFSIVDRLGTAVFASPPAIMWDSTGSLSSGLAPPGSAAPRSDEGPGEASRVAAMGGQADASSVTITPDQALLTGASTRFPVFVDPIVSATRQSWAMVNRTYPAQPYPNWGASEGVGYNNTTGTVHVKRLYWNFNTTATRGRHILAATFKAYEVFSYSCTAAPLDLWQANPISSTTTWNSQPANLRLLASRTVAFGRDGCYPAGQWVEFNAVAAAADSAAKSAAVTGFALRANSEASNTGWKRFTSNAVLSITYNTPPSTPTNLRRATTPCYSANNSGMPVVPNDQPLLTANFTDPDGGNVTGVFGLYFIPPTGATQTVKTWNTSAPSGADQSVPAPSLANGTYVWQTRAYDGTDYSSYSVACYVRVDGDAPPSPTVTVPAGQVYEVGKPASFTFGNGGAGDVVRYRWALNDSVPRSADVPAGAPTISVTPAHFGPNVLRVWGYDAAGNQSANSGGLDFTVAGGAETGRWALDETAGTTAADAVSPGHPLTLTGGASPGVAGRWFDGDPTDRAVAFTASGAATTAATDVVDTSENFSVSAWVRLADLTAGRAAVSKDGSGGSVFSLGVVPGGTDGAGNPTGSFAFSMANPTGGTQAVAREPAPAVTGDWVHLVGVFTAGARMLTLYVNGDNVAAASLTGTAVSTAGVLAVGRGRSAGAAGNFWAGDVDEVHVFDGAIDSTRANQLYATTRP